MFIFQKHINISQLCKISYTCITGMKRKLPYDNSLNDFLKKIKLETLDCIIENKGKLHFNIFKLLSNYLNITQYINLLIINLSKLNKNITIIF